jgi:hypothetical protein
MSHNPVPPRQSSVPARPATVLPPRPIPPRPIPSRPATPAKLATEQASSPANAGSVGQPVSASAPDSDRSTDAMIERANAILERLHVKQQSTPRFDAARIALQIHERISSVIQKLSQVPAKAGARLEVDLNPLSPLRAIAFSRYHNEWSIVATVYDDDRPFETAEVAREWTDCSLDVKAEIAARLPELVKRVIDDAAERMKKLQNGLRAAEQADAEVTSALQKLLSEGH